MKKCKYEHWIDGYLLDKLKPEDQAEFEEHYFICPHCFAKLDQQIAKVSEVETQVGANMKELDSLASTSGDLAVQYAATLSDLQDLDYYETYSLYVRQQQTLEAAQKSFSSISGLSLFKYI